jgi:uncharacterized protein (TIGR02466 family)
VSFQAALAAVEASADTDTLSDLARSALAEGEEERALEKLLPAAERSDSALLWQWCGLLQRSLDDHSAAMLSLACAARLAPDDPSIAHGRARVALEAGLDAVDLFLRARDLAPSEGAVLIGLAAARNAVGEGGIAAEELDAILERAPAWTEGYGQLGQLLSTLGQRERATDAVERALRRFPRQEPLWSTLFGIRLRQEDYSALERDIRRAEAAGLPPNALALYRAISAGELEDETFPSELFDRAPKEVVPLLGVWRIRHLLRLGAVDAALPLIDEELASDRAPASWPYASLAWRLTNDSRSDWLEGNPAFVQVIDLRPDLPPLPELAGVLRGLHIAKGEYLDQSVRGGTQTDGPLLSRVDPFIRHLRRAIVSAVQAYVAKLPPIDPRHPLLAARRDRRIRFSGSWSVRLASGGRHSNHVHPQGWISSALYIALPTTMTGEPQDAGWFTLGQPPEDLGVSVDPWRKIEPKAGQLVLFPSWMWHGTKSFANGERLTVAFDVRPPI